MRRLLQAMIDRAGDYLCLGAGTLTRLDELDTVVTSAVSNNDRPTAQRAIGRMRWIARHVKGNSYRAAAWTYVGSAHWSMEDSDGGLEAYRTALALYEQTQDPDGVLLCNRCISSVLAVGGELDAAEQGLTDSRAAYAENQDLVAVALTELHLASISVSRNDNVSTAVRAGEAARLFREAGRKDALLNALFYQSSALINMGRLADAEPVTVECLLLYNELGIPRGIGRAELLAARLAMASNDPSRAESHVSNACRLGRQSGDTEGMLLIAMSLWEFGDSGRAAALLAEVEDMAVNAANESLLVAVRLTRGFQLVHSGELDRGEEALEAVRSQFQGNEDSTTLAYATNNLADGLRFRGRYAEASKLYGASLRMKRKRKDEWGATYSLEGLAGCAGHLGDIRSASHLLAAADAIRERLGAPIERPLNAQLQAIRDAINLQLQSTTDQSPDPGRAAVPFQELILWACDVSERLGASRPTS